MQMSTKEVVYTLKDDKQELQKQLGCMNGIFQLFDRRYLLGQRRHGHNQKRLPPGQSDNGEKEFSNESEQAKEKNPKVVTKEKHRVSIESSRNSFSSSSSSTALSSLDCSKRVQTEQSSSCQSVVSEPYSSPSLHRKPPDLFIQSPDIRDVVRDSMTREPRVVSIKTAAKEERAGPAMKYVDSPRPFPYQKPIQYDGNNQIAKLRGIPWAVKEVKEISRFSCDERESRYLLKSNMKVKELPRLSLDSKQSFISNSVNEPRRSLQIRQIQGGGDTKSPASQTHESRSNKRPSSSVVARLMGLETLTASIDESEALKTKPCLSEELVSDSRSSRKEELKHDRNSTSPRVGRNQISRQKGVSNVITRIPMETAPWKQEGSARGSQKPVKNKEAQAKTEAASPSVYGEIEKRLTEHGFKTAGKDLRALKQILEAMQKTRKRLEDKDHALDNSSIDHRQNQKSDQPVSPTIKGINPPRKLEFLNGNAKPAKLTSDSIMITDIQTVKNAEAKKDSVGRQRLIDPTLRDRKATGRPLSISNFPEYLPGEKSTSSRYSGTLSPRMQRSKNGIDKPSIHGPSSDWSRTKKQPSMQRTQLGSTTRQLKAKSMDPLQESEQLCGCNSKKRNFSQQSDTVSFQSESNSQASQNDSEVMSTEWIQEVDSAFRPKENRRGNNAERLTEDRPMADHAKHTMEQPSPVSVLDAFYTEDTPSPVKKKSNAFNDDENLRFEEPQDHAKIYDLANSTNLDQYCEFNSVKLANINSLVHKIELLNTNAEAATVNHTATSPCKSETGDHYYVKEILFASGFLKDLDRTTTLVHIPLTGNLINHELFHVLEKTKGHTDLADDEYHKKNTHSKSNEKIRRKMVFDTVNDVLGHKLAMLGPFWPWTNKHNGRILNGDKLLKELCSEIDRLQNNSETGIYDEDDEVINIINADVNKRSQAWDEHCYEVPGLVLDIERLIFKDLVSEVVNAQITSLQDWPTRHRRQLFPV
ncbi:protein LONGIFOLIA 2-like [Cynara cardunculus var. scolymus]|uniref:DUF4378 domain-containing protein n=1 Tax=Cynara cardunculus var. scolymus TaxID=59895 RepID=A0A118J1Z6_CYNCS|nr:protein LONGIFOLIA 2-like [Cynara cardunculus var. scolymus]KVH48444.1 protein of unknown function DUF4378 [Cynara cardunculus var. scolymus]